MSELLTVGYSTRKHNPEFIEYLKKSSGFKKINVIEKVNNGEKSLAQVYNEILNESETDIVVLCHDDIYFDTTSWYSKIMRHFEKSDFGILGVAGTTYMPASGQWWEDRSKMVGIVNHEHEGKKWESKYSDSLENKIKEVVIVDGLFMVIDKRKIKKTFDEEFKGFHFYDIPFCFSNHIEGVKVGVITNIRITHKSIGMTNEEWEKNKIKFSEKYRNQLPIKIKVNYEDKLNILIVTNSLKEDSEFFVTYFELYENLIKNNNVTFIYFESDEKTLNKLKKDKIKVFSISNTPGYKVGDGIWSINTPNGPQKTQPNQFYKIGEPKIDLIFLFGEQTVKLINNLYQNVDKIYFTNNLSENLEIITESDKIKKVFTENQNFDYETIEQNRMEVINNFDNFKIKLVDILNLSYFEPNTKKIKIISGFTDKGGSTTAFINLTNLLNKNGYDCTFYGPHKWHLNKCKSKLLSDLIVNENDILLTHFINPPERPRAKKVILSCHEKNLYEVGNVKQHWDTVVFLNDIHRNYHKSYQGNYTIIPNLKENLKPIDKPEKEMIAGIIGSIDENKQVHVSIQRAINDGCEKIYIFGSISNNLYYENYVKNLIKDNVILYGQHENKQEMYNMIGRVYHSSISEVACLVKDECFLTNTKFFGNDATNNEVSILSNEDVLNKWIKLFEE
jgi:hypothetical protein